MGVNKNASLAVVQLHVIESACKFALHITKKGCFMNQYFLSGI